MGWYRQQSLRLALLLSLAAVGCQGPAAKQAQLFQEQRLALENRNRELQARLNELDRENQRQNALLAQAQQQSQLYQEQAEALRDQMQALLAQNERLKQLAQSSRQEIDALTASARRYGGAMITPNNSLQGNLPELNLPGVRVRRDEDLIRVEIASDQIFAPGDARLTLAGEQLIEQVGSELLRAYPQQRIGVEGHTSDQPPPNGWSSNHELSTAQATTVFNFLQHRVHFPAEQLVVIGYGSNRPLFSNATAAGQARNRRIEIVVFPETVRSRR